MIYAFWGMNERGKYCGHFNSYAYTKTREIWCKLKSESMKGNTIMKGYHHTEETIKKISEAMKGNTFFKGHFHTDETKKKMSEVHKGHFHTDETKKKMSEAQKGHKGIKGNMFAKGYHHTEEARKKMSESRKGHYGYMLGKHHTEETKKSISESLKKCLWWNNGIKCKRCEVCPGDGWVRGRLKNEE